MCPWEIIRPSNLAEKALCCHCYWDGAATTWFHIDGKPHKRHEASTTCKSKHFGTKELIMGYFWGQNVVYGVILHRVAYCKWVKNTCVIFFAYVYAVYTCSEWRRFLNFTRVQNSIHVCRYTFKYILKEIGPFKTFIMSFLELLQKLSDLRETSCPNRHINAIPFLEAYRNLILLFQNSGIHPLYKSKNIIEIPRCCRRMYPGR